MKYFARLVPDAAFMIGPLVETTVWNKRKEKVDFLFFLRTVLLQCVCLLFAADHLERKQAMSGGGDQFNVIKCNDVMPPQPVPCICNVMPPPPVMPQAVCFHCEAWMGGWLLL